MTDSIGFRVINEINLGDTGNAWTLAVKPEDHGIYQDIANKTHTAYGDMLIKVTATTAKTLTIRNDGAVSVYVWNLLASTTVTAVTSGSTTTVSLTANTPVLLAICHVTAVADTE